MRDDIEREKTAVSDEQAFTGVRKTTELTEAEASELYDGLIDLSTKTPTDFVTLSGIAEIAGQLGVAKDELLDFVQTYDMLQVSTNIQGEEGAASIAQFLNITEHGTQNIDRFGAAIVDLGNNFATTERDILETATRLASTADLAGLSTPEILALSTAISSMGINAEAGGSAAGKLMKQMSLASEVGVDKWGVLLKGANKFFEGTKFSNIHDIQIMLDSLKSADVAEFAKSMGMTKDEIARKLDEIVDFSGCERYIDTPVKRYSSGMRVRLGFAVAAHLEPEILVVDEVLAVGDAEFQKKAIGKMQDISQGGGRTVLFVSHNMDSMLNLCQKGVLLENGMIKYEGDIMSTVAEYLNSGNSDFRFTQNEDQAKTGVYVSSVGFTNQGKPSEGIFSFAEDISLRLQIRRKAGTSLDPKTVVSIIIMTLNRTRICNAEIPLSDMDDEKTFSLRYRAGVLLPNKYLIHVAIHIPNISYYDRQDTCTFTVYDNGTEFLKYNHANNGFIMFNPQVTEESSA